MAGLNKIMVIGNLGTDPEMRYTPSGTPVTSFRIAVTRRYNTGEGERREETEWFTVVAWNKLAEQCNQFLSKGRRAYVEGRLRSRRFERRDGTPGFVNEINANAILFLDQAQEPAPGEDGDAAAGGPPQNEEDLPF